MIRRFLLLIANTVIFISLLCFVIYTLIVNCEIDMKKSIVAEHSTWAGIALIANGVSDCLANNYQTGIVNIIAGIFAVLKREH